MGVKPTSFSSSSTEAQDAGQPETLQQSVAAKEEGGRANEGERRRNRDGGRRIKTLQCRNAMMERRSADTDDNFVVSTTRTVLLVQPYRVVCVCAVSKDL